MSVHVLIAGGGTGGHVFPALSVARELQDRASARVTFVGTSRGIESRVVPAAGFALETVRAFPIQRQNPWLMMRGALTASLAFFDCERLLARLRPDVVLSVGGYAAGPVSLVAAAKRIPLALLEPNCVLGLTQRLLLPFAKRLYVAWEELAAQSSKAIVTGVPVREPFVPVPYVPSSPPNVLVLGGSQGARALNERIPVALAQVRSAVGALEVVHQTGEAECDAVVDRYRLAEFATARVVPFIDDVASAVASADLVIARSGAATVAEVAAIGRASILIPFPFAADDHQLKNALALERVGGAFAMRQEQASVDRLAIAIEGLLSDRARLISMARASSAHGKPQARADIAKDLLRWAMAERKEP